MSLIVITGMSGAGKSVVIHSLEDFGYFCVDNIPPQLIVKFAQLCDSSETIRNAAIVSDMRAGGAKELLRALDELAEENYKYDLLFLEANDKTLVDRYKETRRKHPLSKNGLVTDAISTERHELAEIRGRATHIINTTDIKPAKLREHIRSIYTDFDVSNGLLINIITFGYKHGIPLDSDLVFDVRFLPNPFYIDELKHKTGLDEAVSSYVMNFDQSKKFFGMLLDMIEYLIPYYLDDGKSQLVVSIGCTGGHHRSVTIAEALFKTLKENGHRAVITHRDIER